MLRGAKEKREERSPDGRGCRHAQSAEQRQAGQSGDPEHQDERTEPGKEGFEQRRRPGDFAQQTVPEEDRSDAQCEHSGEDAAARAAGAAERHADDYRVRPAEKPG